MGTQRWMSRGGESAPTGKLQVCLVELVLRADPWTAPQCLESGSAGLRLAGLESLSEFSGGSHPEVSSCCLVSGVVLSLEVYQAESKVPDGLEQIPGSWLTLNPLCHPSPFTGGGDKVLLILERS